MSKERLVELIHQVAKDVIKIPTDNFIEYLADYLLANGVIVPPCKVGDKLYARSENRVVECTCDGVSIHNEVTISADFQCDYDCKGCPFNAWKQDFHTDEYSCDGEYGTWVFSLDDFGKTVFLTREEAEAKLKEGENNA